LLLFTAREGYEDIVKLLLEISDLDIKDRKSSQTPLSRVAGYGHEGIVKLLLKTGKVKADSKDIVGWTPLSWVAGYRHEGVVKLLLKTSKVKADSKDKDG